MQWGISTVIRADVSSYPTLEFPTVTSPPTAICTLQCYHLHVNGHFPGKPALASLLVFFFSSPICGRIEPFVTSGTLPFSPSKQSVSNHWKKLKPQIRKQWPSLILSSSTTGLHGERRCSFYLLCNVYKLNVFPTVSSTSPPKPNKVGPRPTPLKSFTKMRP